MPINYKTELQRYHKYYKELEPKMNKPSSKAYTTIIFSFLVISLFGWYAIRPTIQTIIFLQREIRDKTELSKKMEDKITALIEAQAYYQEIEPLLPILDQALPTKPDAIPIVIQLRNLASNSGTLITAINLPTVPLTGQDNTTSQGTPKAPVAAGAKQQGFDITIGVRGPYVNIRAFLEGLLQMRRIIAVESIAIAPFRTETIGTTSAQLSGRLMQLAIKIKTFYLTE